MPFVFFRRRRRAGASTAPCPYTAESCRYGGLEESTFFSIFFPGVLFLITACVSCCGCWACCCFQPPIEDRLQQLQLQQAHMAQLQPGIPFMPPPSMGGAAPVMGIAVAPPPEYSQQDPGHSRPPPPPLKGDGETASIEIAVTSTASSSGQCEQHPPMPPITDRGPDRPASATTG